MIDDEEQNVTAYPICKHCNGTGICNQSITTTTYRTEIYESGDDMYEREIPTGKVTSCPICGTDEGASRFVCKVCNGKGYVKL